MYLIDPTYTSTNSGLGHDSCSGPESSGKSFIKARHFRKICSALSGSKVLGVGVGGWSQQGAAGAQGMRNGRVWNPR